MEKQVKCCLCESRLDKDCIGINKKLLGRRITRFLCIKCLATHLDIDVEDIYARISEIKDQGCALFF